MPRHSEPSRTIDLNGLGVTLTKIGDATHVQVQKDGPLTDEELIQLQILEHELQYTKHDPACS